ncbi:MAG: hypothetical protein ACRDPD_21165 [Streptosporangiaceae bacterium]
MSGEMLGDLDELRHHWGEAYIISTDGSVCTARRRDGKGVLTDPSPAGLRDQIMADYQARRVPRDLP